jgi:hypothetical protein
MKERNKSGTRLSKKRFPLRVTQESEPLFPASGNTHFYMRSQVL